MSTQFLVMESLKPGELFRDLSDSNKEETHELLCSLIETKGLKETLLDLRQRIIDTPENEREVFRQIADLIEFRRKRVINLKEERHPLVAADDAHEQPLFYDHFILREIAHHIGKISPEELFYTDVIQMTNFLLYIHQCKSVLYLRKVVQDEIWYSFRLVYENEGIRDIQGWEYFNIETMNWENSDEIHFELKKFKTLRNWIKRSPEINEVIIRYNYSSTGD